MIRNLLVTQFLIVLAETVYYGLLTNFIMQYVTIITSHVASSQQKWLNKQHTVCLVPLSLSHYLEKQSQWDVMLYLGTIFSCG